MENIVSPVKGYWYDPVQMKVFLDFKKKQELKWWNRALNDWFDRDKTEYREQFKDNRKLALITQGKTQKIVCVDPDTMKAYKLEKWYKHTWIEIKNFTFNRWATGFDT
jgi:hypothetical protein